jgi:hypothetical protein
MGGPEMLRIEMSEVINRPVEDVWAVVTNFDNWAKAASSRSEFRQTAEGPLRVGATVESRRAILGRSLKLHSIVVSEYEPNRAFGLASRDRPRWTLDEGGCSSQSSLRSCGGSGGTKERP